MRTLVLRNVLYWRVCKEQVEYLANLADHVVGGYPEPQQSARFFTRSRDFLSIRTDDDFDKVYDFLLQDFVRRCQLAAGSAAIVFIGMGMLGVLGKEKVADGTS